MADLKFLRTLTASSAIALLIAVPAFAESDKSGGKDASGAAAAAADASKGKDAGDTGKAGDKSGDATGDKSGDKSGDKTGGKTGVGTGDKPGGKDKDPDPETPTDPNDGDRNIERRTVATNQVVCDVSDRRLISGEGSFVGTIDGVECLADGTVMYHVLLSDAFNDEARRVSFRAPGAPTSSRQVRLGLTDMQVKKLIWMNAPH